MTRHQTPCMNFKIFLLLAISYTCQYNILILISDKKIYPRLNDSVGQAVSNRKGYKIQLIIIPEFVLSAHSIKIISFNTKKQ